MNSALRGVSSSLCCSHDLAGALLCSRLFGIQGMTPSLGWSHSTQCGESESSAWYPVLPSCPPATHGSAVHGDPHLGCPVLLGPPSTYVPLGGSTIAPSSGGDHAGGGAQPSCSVIFQGMERLVQSSTPACTVQDMDHHQDHAWS